MIVVIPLIALTIGLILGVMTLRAHLTGLFWAMAAALIGFGIWMFIEGRAAADGWDGIGYAIAVALMAAPCLLGLLIGGMVAWLRQRRAANEAHEAGGDAGGAR